MASVALGKEHEVIVDWQVGLGAGVADAVKVEVVVHALGDRKLLALNFVLRDEVAGLA